MPLITQEDVDEGNAVDLIPASGPFAVLWEATGPGKFEGRGGGTTAELLYQLVMISGQNDELGDVESFGWYGLFEFPDGVYVIEDEADTPEDVDPTMGFIVDEDNSGFFSEQSFDDLKKLKKAWSRLEDEYEDYESEGEEDED
jgi:hypothetical protein